ncbi:hypothetical protein [Catellatospora chokoriensis]|uniref:Uncharacterized protein n=1 Tax=Catellatospora chokoriensis TaxID=310353 RepID=A0A8J3JZ10_9ACTN|nr:hypothetical protein [Catellatospora chokoriensis]GIF89821.1 hypothetical protein Cch02nite_32650 [Catellatospora chokoriensis]
MTAPDVRIVLRRVEHLAPGDVVRLHHEVLVPQLDNGVWRWVPCLPWQLARARAWRRVSTTSGTTTSLPGLPERLPTGYVLLRLSDDHLDAEPNATVLLAARGLDPADVQVLQDPAAVPAAPPQASALARWSAGAASALVALMLGVLLAATGTISQPASPAGATTAAVTSR